MRNILFNSTDKLINAPCEINEKKVTLDNGLDDNIFIFCLDGNNHINSVHPKEKQHSDNNEVNNDGSRDKGLASIILKHLLRYHDTTNPNQRSNFLRNRRDYNMDFLSRFNTDTNSHNFGLLRKRSVTRSREALPCEINKEKIILDHGILSPKTLLNILNLCRNYMGRTGSLHRNQKQYLNNNEDHRDDRDYEKELYKTSSRLLRDRRGFNPNGILHLPRSHRDYSLDFLSRFNEDENSPAILA